MNWERVSAQGTRLFFFWLCERLQVACRSLGYSTGAQVIVGRTSALPGPAGLTDSVSRYACRGDEASLEDCEFELSNGYFADAEYDDGAAVAIICSSADPEGVYLSHMIAHHA